MQDFAPTLGPNVADPGLGAVAREHAPGWAVARARPRDGRLTTRYLTAQCVAVIYLQKLCVPFVWIVFPLAFFLVSVGPALLRGAIGISRSQLALYAAFAFLALASQITVARFSATSIMLLFLVTGIMTLEWRLTSREYARLCRNYSTCMMAPAAFVFIQYLYQLAHGEGQSLSIEPFIPPNFLTGGYYYEQSSAAWVTWNRSNGLVFLEPSFCSAFLACAAINECHVLRRWLRAAFFVFAVVATDGGTGLVMLVIALPLIGFMRRPAETAVLGLVAGVALVVAGVSSAHLPLLSRLSELGTAESSGHSRLLASLELLPRLASAPEYFFSGRGAGRITIDYGTPWPTAKLAFEYGTATSATYFLMVLRWIQWRANLPLAAALFVAFQFTGSYLLDPVLILLIHAIASGRVIDASPSAPAGARAEAPRR